MKESGKSSRNDSAHMSRGGKAYGKGCMRSCQGTYFKDQAVKHGWKMKSSPKALIRWFGMSETRDPQSFVCALPPTARSALHQQPCTGQNRLHITQMLQYSSHKPGLILDMFGQLLCP